MPVLLVTATASVRTESPKALTPSPRPVSSGALCSAAALERRREKNSLALLMSEVSSAVTTSLIGLGVPASASAARASIFLASASSALMVRPVRLILTSAEAATSALPRPAKLLLTETVADAPPVPGLKVTERAIWSLAHLIFWPALPAAALKQSLVSLSVLAVAPVAICETAALYSA